MTPFKIWALHKARNCSFSLINVATPQSKRYHSLVHIYPKFEPSRQGMNLSNGLTALLIFLKLKERLVRSVMSNQNVSTQSLRNLGSSVNLLSPKQISMIAWEDLEEIQENFTVQWTKGQMHALVKKKLSNLKVSMMDSCSLVPHTFFFLLFSHCAVSKDKLLSGEDLRTLKSLARGLPSRVLKRVKAQGILKDPEAMNNISKQMRKGQLKALLQGVSEDQRLTLWLKTRCDSDDFLSSASFICKSNKQQIHVNSHMVQPWAVQKPRTSQQTMSCSHDNGEKLLLCFSMSSMGIFMFWNFRRILWNIHQADFLLSGDSAVDLMPNCLNKLWQSSGHFGLNLSEYSVTVKSNTADFPLGQMPYGLFVIIHTEESTVFL